MKICVAYSDAAHLWFGGLATACRQAFNELGHKAELVGQDSPPFKLKGYDLHFVIGPMSFPKHRTFPRLLSTPIVCWEFEQITGNSEFNKAKRDRFQTYASCYDKVFVSADSIAFTLQRFDLEFDCKAFSTPVGVLRIGYHPSFDYHAPEREQEVDVLFCGTLSKRRQKLLDTLRARKLRIKGAFDSAGFIHGAALAQEVARAKVCLNVHFSDDLFFEQHRIIKDYVSNHGFVITETLSDDPNIGGIVQAPIEQLADTIEHYVREKSALDRRALADTSYTEIQKRLTLKDQLGVHYGLVQQPAKIS